MVKVKEGDLEVVKKVAVAYFARSTPEVKQIAHEAFDEADEDGNGTISLEEFLQMIDDEQIEESTILFKGIDTNGDGYLDFYEFLTVFFLMVYENGVEACAECSSILVTMYFSCHECHLSPSTESYDLCTECYRRGKFTHSHNVFLDNLTLLRRYKSNGAGKSEDKPEAGRVSLDSNEGQMVEARQFKSQKLEDLKYAVSIGALAAQMGASLAAAQVAQVGASVTQRCTIM